MNERARAVTIATSTLDDATRDPDSDQSILARQLLRCIDRAAPSAHDPGTAHRYRIECEVCGQIGMIRLTVDPEAQS